MALRALPRIAGDAADARRSRAAARAAFARAWRDEAPIQRWFGTAARIAMPVVLTAVVGIYMMWAIGAANALFR